MSSLLEPRQALGVLQKQRNNHDRIQPPRITRSTMGEAYGPQAFGRSQARRAWKEVGKKPCTDNSQVAGTQVEPSKLKALFSFIINFNAQHLIVLSGATGCDCYSKNCEQEPPHRKHEHFRFRTKPARH